ncbi:AAA family ATPase [Natranaerobius trueperi]|uniref:ATPase n=1 Tax=Natranaerobius trueperi TaxID=759412 RepID=A0A226C1R1_9FIRM|nr:AAA family ATPase [Natranaerobius trueperi]OWZ84310.1 ATPase [Natranaerobius trueperi]
MILEISVGIYLAVIISLLVIGITPKPLIFVGVIFAFFLWIHSKKGSGSSSPGKVVNKSIPEVTFEEIGGQKTAINEVKEALEFLLDKKSSKELGIRPIKGLLLSGPPGNGKTLIAKAASKYTDSVFMSTSGSEFIEMYAGVGAQRVRKMFKNARKRAHKNNKTSAVIFIDELDVIGAKRGSNGNHMEYEQTLNQLLVEMDGLDSEIDNIDILIMGATNRLESLDNALTRPGRFDRIVSVEPPDKEGRLHILKIHCQNKPLSSEVDLSIIASETFGFSGAHLENLVNEAAILAMRRKQNVLKMNDFYDSIEKVIMGEELPRKPKKQDLERIAYHEIGHALVIEVLNPHAVSKIAITSRGKALGYTRRSPQEDSYLKTSKSLKQELSFLLAGSKFEEYFLGYRSTGNKDDLNKAFQIAREIIKSGMSPLGIVNYDNLSQDEINQTTQKLTIDSEEQIEQILSSYSNIVPNLKDNLLEREKISGEELREFLKGVA